jgi:Glyoxalase-like domain
MMSGRCFIVLLMILLLASCRSSMTRSSEAGGLDHILLGVPDLDAGVTAFEQATGVTPLRGGKRPSRGTENALVSLGNGSYLEIIAPQRGTDVSRLHGASQRPG